MALASSKTTHAAAHERHQIIVLFSAPPSTDDILGIAQEHLASLPEELLDKCTDLQVMLEEFPDTATEQEMDLSDRYDLLAMFRAGSEIAPGVMRKTSKVADTLILFRRPILDLWCENGEDLAQLIRQVIIGELGAALEFSEDDIEEMSARHYQGLL
jgi:predicted Zn-dependent protease with MMP-like domain